ncbi:hypothetical protein MF271_22775 (plasmid) [Deinococcus sp. KNUC1210]|uniref:hypothetical protein n=1 Tax=Deinococcus sp. KNUC1210 TaxID=2917691 RepID=UPI001EF140E8|nr:hypothetical protein [Deinococcus sp. KNUC1210]ULH18290.1 hypothetical protein MF271_22775 [Deinococcus sp. KNUC1210]
MSDLHGWLAHVPAARWIPLFDTDDTLTVRTHLRGPARDRRILTRAPSFDAAMIDLIETGLQDDTWTGLLYLMGLGDTAQEFTPLYIGKTERRGKTHS